VLHGGRVIGDQSTHGPAEAGSVIIRGQDERDLVVRILADADEPPIVDEDHDDSPEKGSNDVA